MIYEWERGLFTIHKNTGDFLCPEERPYVPPKPKSNKRRGQKRTKGTTDG